MGKKKKQRAGETIEAEVLDLGAKGVKPTSRKIKVVLPAAKGLGKDASHTPEDSTIPARKPVNTSLKAPPAPKEEVEGIDFNIKDYIRFGSDNLFPQSLAAVNRQSPTHRGVLSNKTLYTIGNGFVTDNAELEEYIKVVNNKNESLKKVTKKIIRDYYGQGNAYMEVVTDDSKSFLSLFHKDSTEARVGTKSRKNWIGLFPDWRRVDGREDQIEWLSLYPTFTESKDDGFLHSIIHIKEYEEQYRHYGLAGWFAGLNGAVVGYKTTKWNLSRLDNDFSTSGVLEVFGDKGDAKITKAIKDFKKKRTGEGKQGTLLVVLKTPGGEKSSYTPIIQNTEGEWIKLHEQSDTEIITAHNWFRALTAMADNTGFDTNRIRQEYTIALSTVIPEARDVIMDDIKMVLEGEGFDTSTMEFVNKSVSAAANDIDVNRVLTKRQGLDILGFEKDENVPDEQYNEFIITDKKNGNNGQEINNEGGSGSTGV